MNLQNHINLKNSLILVVVLLAIWGISQLVSYSSQQTAAIQEAADIVASSSSNEDKINSLKNIAEGYSTGRKKLDVSVSLAYDKTECQQLFGYWFTYRESDLKLADLLWDVMKSKNCPLD